MDLLSTAGDVLFTAPASTVKELLYAAVKAKVDLRTQPDLPTCAEPSCAKPTCAKPTCAKPTCTKPTCTEPTCSEPTCS